MAQVCERYGIETRGDRALCPFHDDHSPSMKLYPGDRGWYCFACGEGGDVIRFAEKYFGVGFRQAIEKLSADFGLAPARYAPQSGTAAGAKCRDAEKIRLREAYFDALDAWQAVKDYVRGNRPADPEQPEAAWLSALGALEDRRRDAEEAYERWQIYTYEHR